MLATEVEKPMEVAKSAVAQQAEAAEKPLKHRKLRVPKEKRAKATKTAAHPPYFEMIKDALLALNEKGGSSPYAIAKYMEEKHKAVLPANFKKILGLQLKNSAAKGKLVKVKASYKLSEARKKEKAAVAKPAPAAAKKTRAAKATAAGSKRKVEAAKKVAAKKATPAKVKQPKSIKSPSNKKVKKAQM